MRRKLAALAAAAMLSAPMMATPSEVAAQKQVVDDGLVVIQIGNVKVTDTVDVAAAVVVQACDVADLQGLNVLNIITAIDQDGGQFSFCENDAGQEVQIKNNKR